MPETVVVVVSMCELPYGAAVMSTDTAAPSVSSPMLCQIGASWSYGTVVSSVFVKPYWFASGVRFG